MDTNALLNGLLMFVAFVAFVALHEWAHAWTAVKCGDDTPRLQGRLTLDPLAHADPIGTVILPLFLVIASAAGGPQLLFGWGKPVEVNLNNFGRRRIDDILVSGAGPAMNFLLAIVLLLIMKGIELTGNTGHLNPMLPLVRLTLFLCFFNLLPVPPLDGGHILRNLVGMSDEAYRAMTQYSFMFFAIIVMVPGVGRFLSELVRATLVLLMRPFGWELVR